MTSDIRADIPILSGAALACTWIIRNYIASKQTESDTAMWQLGFEVLFDETEGRERDALLAILGETN